MKAPGCAWKLLAICVEVSDSVWKLLAICVDSPIAIQYRMCALLAMCGKSGQYKEAPKCIEAPGWTLETRTTWGSSWLSVEVPDRMRKLLKCVQAPEWMFEIQALCMKSTSRV